MAWPAPNIRRSPGDVRPVVNSSSTSAAEIRAPLGWGDVARPRGTELALHGSLRYQVRLEDDRVRKLHAVGLLWEAEASAGR